MNRYWLKIIAGAVLVFAVGMALWTVGRRTFDNVRAITDSDVAVRVPLFGLLGFKVDGQRHGSIRTITVERDGPEVVRAITVRVNGDSNAIETLSNCTFTLSDPEQIDENSEFSCLEADSLIAALEDFGEVRISGPGDRILVRRIVLPAELVADWRDQSVDPVDPALADRLADSITAAVDSAVEAGLNEGLGAMRDSGRIRAGVQTQIDAARQAAREARERANATAEAPPAPPTPAP